MIEDFFVLCRVRPAVNSDPIFFLTLKVEFTKEDEREPNESGVQYPVRTPFQKKVSTRKATLTRGPSIKLTSEFS